MYHSITNQAYWNQKPYKGFGIGACSFDGSKRFINEKNVTTYLKKIENDDYESISKKEHLTTEQVKIETLMLGLRQTKGMDLHDVVYLLSCSEKERFLNNLKILKNQGLIQEIYGHIALTLKGMALEHEIILKLI